MFSWHGTDNFFVPSPSRVKWTWIVSVFSTNKETLECNGHRPLRATSHTRPRACYKCTPSILIGGKGGGSPNSLTLCLRDQWSMWMQYGCKAYVDSYTTSNGSCVMVTWTHFKNHLLKAGFRVTTMALQKVTTVDLLCFYHVWGPTWIKMHWNSIWLRAQHLTSHYTWGSVTARHDFVSYYFQLLFSRVRWLVEICMQVLNKFL